MHYWNERRNALINDPSNGAKPRVGTKKSLSIRLRPTTLVLLDQLSSALGTSRGALVDELIDYAVRSKHWRDRLIAAQEASAKEEGSDSK